MRTTIAFVVGGLVGIIAGSGGMLIAYPFLFPPPVASEAAPTAAAVPVQKAGTFRFDEKAPGRDRVHWANGSGAVFRGDVSSIIRLDEDFVAGPGPNFWIYLNTVPVGEEGDFNADQGRVKIAPLRSFKGGQNYTLPAGLDIGKFHTVTIWCESFGAYIASAVLPKA